MFSKNLKFYRLKKQYSKKVLASMINVTPMAITNYENGSRRPNMEIINRLAKALDVKVSDFLINRSKELVFKHGEFRKTSSLSLTEQEYIKSMIEDYIYRFYEIVDILGGEVIPKCLHIKKINNTGDIDKDSKIMRKVLKLQENGPINNLCELLENIGIIVCFFSSDYDGFYGMNGLVNNRYYIAINKKLTSEKIRSTIAHELAHIIFNFDNNSVDKEKYVTLLSLAFLFPKEDAIRELGIKRTRISKDMLYICKEYGISMYLLVKQAYVSKIINSTVEREFYVKAKLANWDKNEPSRISEEKPTLFYQLVFRAVSEQEISIQKGAELLKESYEFVRDNVYF